MHHGDIWFTGPLFLILLVRQKIFGGAFWRWFARKKNTDYLYLHAGFDPQLQIHIYARRREGIIAYKILLIHQTQSP